MSSTDRQNRLLLAEDWRRIYQSFRYADFKSYDFDNLRRTMINYIRQNYPEDFNDYIESSEYLALIDLIAFLGQNISFRTDLNARENFIELAERRESVLRMARLLSYNVTRNQAANGLLKFASVSTTETVFDSNGQNLSGKTVKWNNSVNTNWYEQFIKIINSALPAINKFGTPNKTQTIAGIPTEKYTIQTANNILPMFTFSSTVNGTSLEFEVVNTDIDDGEIVEAAPSTGSPFGFLYRDNGQGPGSTNSGFFAHFRQGSLQRGNFEVDLPVPNQKVDIDISNINNSDVWLYSLDAAGNEDTLWTKVEAVEGNNVIYNSLSKGIREYYSVLTRTDDRISLIFSDGTFGDLPKGSFTAYYRTSANKDYDILPANIKNVTVRIPYISTTGRTETLIAVMELATPVYNASSTETTDSIKTNAPSTYYTQNRLITGEDYNVGPLGIDQEIIKVKAINRTSSGINRYYDLRDATGKYSTTTLFADDGVLYKEFFNKVDGFNFSTRTDIESVIRNKITNIIKDNNLRNFYYNQYTNQDYTILNYNWVQQTKDTNVSTGFIQDENTNTLQVATFTTGPLRFIEPGAMVKFTAPIGKHFMPDGTLMAGDANHPGATTYKWCKVVKVYDGGNAETSNGLGGIVLDDVIPSDAILNSVKPKFIRDIQNDVISQMIDQTFAYRTFGLRYDREDRKWKVILQEDINILGDFSVGLSGDTTGQKLDASWLLLFETNGETYTVTYRTLRYLFESKDQTRFYFDNNKKIYDSKTGSVIRDKVSILSINRDLYSANEVSPFTVDLDWAIDSEYRDASGYVDTKKVEVVFFDSDDDGVVDDPELFEKIVADETYIFTKKVNYADSEFYEYTDEEIEFSESPNTTKDKLYYVPANDSFIQTNSSTGKQTEVFGYKAFLGRDNIKFQYIHGSDENTRIDPSSSNIVDLFVLTKTYDTLFRQYLIGNIDTIPLPLSSDQLYRSYGSEINKVKSISDEVIYHPVKYKVLFGDKAETSLKATFKIVKSKDRVLNDNDVKSRVISAINQFFSLENWEFGETFYWSELSTYIMTSMSPDLSSIVIVPNDATKNFGSLFEVASESDELFISSAQVTDIEIITANTAEQLKSQGAIVTSASNANSGIQSTSSSSSSIIVGGGY
mgnify:FL=1